MSGPNECIKRHAFS